MRVQAGKESVDIGMCVKNSRNPVCVPDYTRPAKNGPSWQYSQAIVIVLTEYKARAVGPSQHVNNQMMMFPDTAHILP